MYSTRSSYAKRKGTGQKSRRIRIVRRQVTKQRHRRYAGLSKPAKARPSKSGRHRRFFGRAAKGLGKPRVKNPLGRHGKRRFLGRKKSAHKIVRRKKASSGAAISAANYINMF